MVDFRVGQKIDRTQTFSIGTSLSSTLARGVLVPVDGAAASIPVPVVENAAEEEFVPPPMVEVVGEAEQPEVVPKTVSAAPRPRGRPAGKSKDATRWSVRYTLANLLSLVGSGPVGRSERTELRRIMLRSGQKRLMFLCQSSEPYSDPQGLVSPFSFLRPDPTRV